MSKYATTLLANRTEAIRQFRIAFKTDGNTQEFRDVIAKIDAELRRIGY